MTEGSRKAIIAAFCANLRIAIAKFVDRLIHLRTEHLGPDQILVAAKLEFASQLTFPEVVDAINATVILVRTAVHAAQVTYREPDILTQGYLDQDGPTRILPDHRRALRGEPAVNRWDRTSTTTRWLVSSWDANTGHQRRRHRRPRSAPPCPGDDRPR